MLDFSLFFIGGSRGEGFFSLFCRCRQFLERVGDLAKACGLSKDGVKWNLRKLKNMNLIRMVGYTKGGYWEVGKIA